VSRRGVAAAGCAAALLTGCHHSVAGSGAARSSDQERGIAQRVAHEQQEKVTGTFLVATYRPDAGDIAQSNTGHRCTAGHTLLVRLVWNKDAGFDHGGVVGAPPDGPRKALELTVNVPSGQVCLMGASYSHVRPRPGEIYLYGPRRDLVTPQ
jgi:hypothetical protein